MIGQDAVVHIIDDDASMRSSITALLRSVDVASSAYDSCQAFLSAKVVSRPGCLLLDVRMPGMSGLDFLGQMARLDIVLPVIMMTAHGDVPMTVRAMKAGAVDFLPKPFRDQDLLDAVAVAIERDRAQAQIANEHQEVRSRYALLSERERQVVNLVTAGKLNKQAAFELGLSEITVKIYRSSAMKKMAAKTLADLVKMTERLKL